MDGGSCPPNQSSITSYVPLAVPLGAPLDRNNWDPIPGADAGPTPPSGWNFYNINGAICRDGSPMGIFVKYGTVNKLMVFFEGGGLCFSSHFCDHNPANMMQEFSADPETQGQTIGEVLSALGSPAIRQQPSNLGIFDPSNTANPFAGWNQVYIPYCTGDAHFGTIDQGAVADISGAWARRVRPR